MNPETFEKVRQVMSVALDVPAAAITPEMKFGDIPQWDSMGHMELMMALEANFNVEVTADSISALIGVPEICEHISTMGEG